METRHVFLLWHTHEVDGDSDAKLLGVYSSEEKATQRMRAARLLPGFADAPEAFEIVPYELDRDEWPEGFRALDGVDVPAWFAPDCSRSEAGPSSGGGSAAGIVADSPRWDAWWEHFGAPGLKHVLALYWDPIGLYGDPGFVGEYDAYIDHLGPLLRRGADTDEIANLLTRLSAAHMGVPRPSAASADAARTIASWYAEAMRKVARLPPSAPT